MADTQFHGLGTKAAPNDYTLPGGLEFVLKAARAVFDGSGAATPFLPALEILSDSGSPVGTYVSPTAVAAGSAADVSFAPFLRNAAAGSSSSGIVFDADNTGGWLTVITTSFEPVVGNGIFFHATGDGNPIQLTAEGGINLDDPHGWGIVIKSTTGLGGSADVTIIPDRDFTVNAGRTISMQAASFFNIQANDTLVMGGSNAVQLVSNGTGGINVQVNNATAKLFIQGTTGALIVLDPTILPTVNPGVAGALWNNAGVLHVS